MNIYRLIGLAILLACSGHGGLNSARAATATSSLAVSATVEATCSFASQSFSGSDHSIAAVNENITRGINCSHGTVFSARLDNHLAADETMAALGSGSNDVVLSHDRNYKVVTEIITF